jgi:hypothetical protein
MNFKETGCKGGFNASGLGSAVGTCEHSNEPLGSMKYQASNYLFLKKDSDPCD